jgi:hypothetical protein
VVGWDRVGCLETKTTIVYDSLRRDALVITGSNWGISYLHSALEVSFFLTTSIAKQEHDTFLVPQVHLVFRQL